MAYASVTYTSASGTTFALTNSLGNPIEYLRRADVFVYVNGVLKTLTTDYTFNTAGTAIVLNTAVSGATVLIQRTTGIDDNVVTYTAGSTLTAADLNNASNQNLYALQEFRDTYGALLGGGGDLSDQAAIIGSGETWASNNSQWATTAATDNRIDSKIDTALTTDVVAGTDISITDNSPSSGQITINHNVAGANTTVNNSNGIVLQDITVTAQGHVTSVGSYDLDNRYYTEAELDAGQLDNRYYTETEADNRFVNVTGAESIDGVKTFTSSPIVPTPTTDYQAATKVYVDANFWNKTSETIDGTEPWVSNNTTVPTTQAVNGRIIDLLNDIGSYVVVATEVTFPNNGVVDGGGSPDAGVLVEVTDASGLTWNGSGTSTNATTSNSTAVTITGITGTGPLNSGGMQVLSTSTLHTYTFVKWTITSSVAQTISDNITEILQADDNAAAAAASASAAATSASNAATSASNAATSASNAATSATNAANSATTAQSTVSTLLTLGYLANWGLITDAVGTSSDYGSL
jgi:hypothetical protein